MTTRATLPILLAVGLLLFALPVAGQSLSASDGGPPSDDVAADAAVTPLALRAAEAHRAAARYPASSQPLATDAFDPLLDERIAHPVVVDGDGGDGEPVRLVAWVDSSVVAVGEPVVVGARIDGDDDGSILSTLATGKAALSAEIVAEDGTVVARAKLFDDGVAPDPVAGDGIATAALSVPAKHVPALAASYMVRVDALTPAGVERSAVLGFVYSNPAGTLTGAFRDAVVDGDLVVEAEIEVRRAARFHLAATVEDADGLIGQAQAATELEPGTRWIALRFYGLMFHERPLAGPLAVGSATLSTTGGVPNALGPVLFDVHQVTERPVDAFRAAPYGDPARLEAAQRLEASVR